MLTESSQHGVSLDEKAQGAMIGAAIGDALGWPQEFPKRQVGRGRNGRAFEDAWKFEQWIRRDGGSYNPHEETIYAGEYSDDTQLLLCTARSLIEGAGWWECLVWRELPTWKLYDRGGGGATNRAVNAWLTGKHPWLRPKAPDWRKYFDAGGNGVTMRILPHCLRGAAATGFESVACDIVTDGVCTHGHPRALVGALAYGYAVWLALGNQQTLRYGQLIEDCLLDIDTWSRLPDIDDVWPTWRAEADGAFGGDYGQEWQRVVEEIRGLLVRCREALDHGALALEREVLEQLGCFSGAKGAGTVSAAAAIFLASRFAADPRHGVEEAAYAHGADTDTLASMTGGLLGAVCGREWLGTLGEAVQDAQYIQTITRQLVNQDVGATPDSASFTRVRKSSLDAMKKAMAKKRVGESIRLPDGREAKVLAILPHRSRSKTLDAASWKLATVDGQTVYIKRLARVPQDQAGKDARAENECSSNGLQPTPVEVLKLGIRVPVHDLSHAREFYADILGLKISAESQERVRLDCGIVLVFAPPMSNRGAAPTDDVPGAHSGPHILLEIRDLQPAFERVRGKGATIVSPPAERGGWVSFRCLDTEGNIIELVERRSSNATALDQVPSVVPPHQGAIESHQQEIPLA